MLLFCSEDVQPSERDKFVRIADLKEQKNFTVYVIEIQLGQYKWTVEKRYSEFLEFDRERFKHLKQSFLPPKKFVGNQDAEFLSKRRAELEQYLRTVFELEVWLQKKRRHVAIPRVLAKFLDFHKYEIHAVCEEMASDFFENGDKLLLSNDFYEFTPLQLHAITERLKLSEPTCESNDLKLDFGHVLDFVHRLKHLKIKGLKKNIGTSNISPNSLPFNLNAFKNLSSLWFVDCNPAMISGLSSCRQTVCKLTIHYSLHFTNEIIADKDVKFCNDQQPGADLDCASCDSDQYWKNIKRADLSFNQLSTIDQSVIFLRNVEKLDLTFNCLTEIRFLQYLPNLCELNLSNNRIEKIDNWHHKLGNLKRLILSANKMRSVDGLNKLYSLEYLDLRDNSIVQTSDIWPVGCLPCLETLLLTGNPLEASVEYRSRVLEAFGERACEVKLDNEKPTQRELDTVGVRLAIRKAKEDREKQLHLAREQISRALNFDSESSVFGSSVSERSNSIDSYLSETTESAHSVSINNNNNNNVQEEQS